MNNDRSSALPWKPTAVFLAVTAVLSSQTFAKDLTNTTIGENVSYPLTKNEVFETLDVSIEPAVKWEQYFIKNEQFSFTVTGTTKFISHSYNLEGSEDQERGTCGFLAAGSGVSVNLKGDVDAYVEHHNIDIPDIGANLFYAKNAGLITLGDVGTTTKA